MKVLTHGKFQIVSEVEVPPQVLLTEGWQIYGVDELQPHDEVPDLLNESGIEVLVHSPLGDVVVSDLILLLQPSKLLVV